MVVEKIADIRSDYSALRGESSGGGMDGRGAGVWCPRQDSNLGTRFRKPLLYPLSYGGAVLLLSASIVEGTRGLAQVADVAVLDLEPSAVRSR